MPSDRIDTEQVKDFDSQADFEFGQDTMESVTQLIVAAENGHSDAWDRVYSLLYGELHRAAQIQIRRVWKRGDRSPTSLINRTWLRLDQGKLGLKNRQHMIAVLSKAMRYALLDEARRLQALKREDAASTSELDSISEPSFDPELEQLVEVGRAIEALAAIDPRLAQLVEMRYFAGMNDIEIGEVLDLTDRTIRRDWRKARAFLAAYIGGASDAFGDIPEQPAL
ncbi:sigma-70 family RNA polymerase sigma factor [Lysobacter maris]|uniref:Sigma-70 family RNA polymerase sigma factor n=1 Tax=Marilutibacter maris TaxID=1605891 RepID=A0A508ADH9_9GAMM|nr:sigma-70 family RNA polymerase sigma factor [Lysobacter maris]